MGLLRQGYWSGLSFPSPGSLLKPGIEPYLLYWQVDSLPLSVLLSSEPVHPDCLEEETVLVTYILRKLLVKFELNSNGKVHVLCLMIFLTSG